MFFNRLIVFTKRILASRLYLAMIGSVIIMSVIYALLPAHVKSTDIKVALYIEHSNNDTTSSYGDELYLQLKNSGSIYTYCLTDSPEVLREGVESGEFECGFYIPAGFFAGYISGLSDCPKIIRYETASTTLGNAITESVFSQIFKLCSADILYLAYDNPYYNDILLKRLNSYINGDKIFQIEDHSSNRIIKDNEIATLNIPIRQLSILLVIFSGLLGLLMYVGDAERNIYIAQNWGQNLSLRLSTLLGCIIPMLIVVVLCCLVTYKTLSDIFPILISAISTVIFAYFPGVFFKKRSSLARLLPVIMLILIPVVVFFD